LYFDDPHAVSVLDRIEDSEERWQTMGLVHDVLIRMVAHLASEENGEGVIRIISARRTTPRERSAYYEETH
jgi:uncharacterized DUF497 family protein